MESFTVLLLLLNYTLKMSSSLSSLAPFDLHKHLINQYILTRKGATALLKRDTSRDKRDIDVIRENHKFLWDDDEEPNTWEKRLARKYYDKLYKEYCICDLSRFKENKVAMRWQTEPELVSGKGQFVCGEKRCKENEGLRTWEVNFAYLEEGAKKNALVKLRLCPECSYKLNYKSKKKEIKCKLKKRTSCSTTAHASEIPAKVARTEEAANLQTESDSNTRSTTEEERNIWKEGVATEERSRDEDFEDYLEHLLF
ncbi:protein FRA10AC1 homolog isoform X2 [Macrosteles quadrilineatus]|uniref:protein FRA10AC1 homolog isoform X2 n=1 Tax=Macrosteles quadrilineatus TaxID=74068 RepID=UPI0023E0B85F|nr:protein FRA10AC1 homolog isoform X2 [Macrosteles quadrilineatus]